MGHVLCFQGMTGTISVFKIAVLLLDLENHATAISQNMELAPAIDRINERIKTLADGKRIRFLNINDQLADSSGRLLREVSSDGLHLEEPGYEIWAQALKPIFEEILGPPAKEDHAPPPTGNPAASR